MKAVKTYGDEIARLKSSGDNSGMVDVILCAGFTAEGAALDSNAPDPTKATREASLRRPNIVGNDKRC